MDRIVVIGDLNGADDALVSILRGTGLVDGRTRWAGGKSELVQVGDIFNRGSGAKHALEILQRLRREARAAGGRVTALLGNHEVMTALGNEAYCTEGEYLSFATERERETWPEKAQRALRRIFRDHGPRGPITPIGPRVEAWKAMNVPGRTAMRRALAPGAQLGRVLRNMPIAHLSGGAVFVHAGLLPSWARLGIDGLNRVAKEAWRDAPRFYRRLPRGSLFRNPEGPLWNRSLVGSHDPAPLVRSLELLGARRMVVGHTETENLPGGSPGRILTRFDHRLVCVDVGLRSGESATRAALIIEGGVGLEWTQVGTRTLWRDA